MNRKLKILSFGEIMLRLSPAGGGAIADSTAFDACYGGTEANVLACMVNFGCSAEYLTALPDNQIGGAVLRHLKSFGVNTGYVKTGGEVLGSYFVESGNGSRGACVIYNRSNSEITHITPDDFNYDEVFDGVDLFHISGISFALSPSCTQTAFRLLEEARRHGVKISFDFNYRSKLWTTAKAGEVFKRVLPYADIVLASTLDLSVFLGKDENTYFDEYDSKILVLRDRKPVPNTSMHEVKLTVYDNRGSSVKKFTIAETQFNVLEKIGGGDAFDGAMLYKLLTGAGIEEAATFAVKAFILKHQIKGDTFTLSERDVEEAKIDLNI